MLKPLTQLLLTFWRELAKLGIAFQGAHLLIRGQVFMFPQPSPGMLAAATFLLSLCRTIGMAFRRAVLGLPFRLMTRLRVG